LGLAQPNDKKNYKPQALNHKQAPITKIQKFENWNLEFIWNLCFWIWNFLILIRQRQVPHLNCPPGTVLTRTSLRSERANHKLQAPNHKQAPITKIQKFENWNLEFIWNLCFWIWNLRAECNEARAS